MNYRLKQLQEYLQLDSTIVRGPVAVALALAGIGLFRLKKTARGLDLLTRAHRMNASTVATRIAEHFMRMDGPRRRALVQGFRRHLDTPEITAQTQRFVDDPGRLLGSRILVTKSPHEREKGILVLDYSFTFRVFGVKFDVPKIASRYRIVLEPSWTGYCDLDIASYAMFDFPVYVQSIEPRDNAFLERFRSNLRPIPVAGNWWVDHRIMRPVPGVAKEFDFVYLGAWSRYKRHDRLFDALRKTKRRGVRFNLLLIGYNAELTKDDIFRSAKEFGLASMIEMREGLNGEEVNLALNRSKVNILWSRREGFNRAIIEGMFAGTPCLLRAGHNFGHPYPYINSQTGSFATEVELPKKLISMRDNYASFSPRDWALTHMSCQRATEILGARIREDAEREGETWTEEPVVKVTRLNTMAYWNPADAERFAPDYLFLRSALR